MPGDENPQGERITFLAGGCHKCVLTQERMKPNERFLPRRLGDCKYRPGSALKTRLI